VKANPVAAEPSGAKRAPVPDPARTCLGKLGHNPSGALTLGAGAAPDLTNASLPVGRQLARPNKLAILHPIEPSVYELDGTVVLNRNSDPSH